MWQLFCAPHWWTLSRHTADFGQMWPKSMPLVGGLCCAADFGKMWTKNMPLDGGLYHTMDFNQMWSKLFCPTSEGFVTQWTLIRCGPRMHPSLDDFVMLQTLTKCGLKKCACHSETVSQCEPKSYVGTNKQTVSSALIQDSRHCCGWSFACCLLHSLQLPSSYQQASKANDTSLKHPATSNTDCMTNITSLRLNSMCNRC